MQQIGGDVFQTVASDEQTNVRTTGQRKTGMCWVLGLCALDLWDSWSNELGEIKTRIENRVHLFMPAFSACVVFVE